MIKLKADDFLEIFWAFLKKSARAKIHKTYCTKGAKS